MDAGREEKGTVKTAAPVQTTIHPDTCCVLFFLRFPGEGAVKTRLAAEIGSHHAVELYTRFILDELAILADVPCPVILCFTPHDLHPELIRWLGDDRIYHAQKGEDLGSRMDEAFTWAFSRGFERVLLVGSDIPDLTNAVFEEGFKSLLDHDGCLAPSLDGGYYCIGFTRSGYCPAVFYTVTWSTPQVCTRTQNVLEGEGRSLHMLPAGNDVDTMEDLVSLCQRSLPDAAPRTRAYLKATGLWAQVAPVG